MLHITPLVLDVYLSFALVVKPPTLEQQYLDLFIPLSHPVAVASRPKLKGVVIDLKQCLASRNTGDK